MVSVGIFLLSELFEPAFLLDGCLGERPDNQCEDHGGYERYRVVATDDKCNHKGSTSQAEKEGKASCWVRVHIHV